MCTSCACAAQVSIGQVDSYTYLRYGVNMSLEPDVSYTVRVRARNGIGWSVASAGTNCTASAVRPQAFPWVAVLVPTILAVLCLLGLVGWCYTKNISRILAPKLKKKDSHGDTAHLNQALTPTRRAQRPSLPTGKARYP